MTKQEIFTKCKNHLLKQGFKCTLNKDANSKDMGIYKRPDGAACPVGILIPDNEYDRSWIFDPHIERKTVAQLWRTPSHLSEKTRQLIYDNISLLTDLQNLHDLIPVKEWENELKKIATKHEVEYAN